jgi:GTP cyclohydrolase I
MQTETKNFDLSAQVLNCELKDQNGLNDFQKIPDPQGIAIPKVGISRYRFPLNFSHPDGIKNHDVTASMHVNLSKGKTGINMSRLCKILQTNTINETFSYELLKNLLQSYRVELRDHDAEPALDNAYLKFKLSFPLKQNSLRSNNWGWQYYESQIEGVSEKGKTRIYLSVKYEYSSTCPCSLSMAKQYENEFALGLTTEGVGIGVAHGQRSEAVLRVELSEQGIAEGFFIGDLVQILREAIPTETQSLVKRIDEQAFAILNGSNPMFVEHASKRSQEKLDQVAQIKDWVISFEHFESLHSHNATAIIAKEIAGGFDINSPLQF